MKLVYSLFVAVVLLGSLNFNAAAYDNQNVYWTGAVSDRWEDPANWEIGDSIDEADGVRGVYVAEEDLWIKTWADPTNGQVWFDKADLTQESFVVIIHIKPSANIAIADTASHLLYNNLTAPEWTRPNHMWIDSGAVAEIATPYAYQGNAKSIFYINKDVHVNGKLTLRDSAFLGSRNQIYVGTEVDGGELIIGSGCKVDAKVITTIGEHIVQVDTIEGTPVETVTDRVGKIYVRGGEYYPGGNYGVRFTPNGWGEDGMDVSAANGSCIVLDSGMVRTQIGGLGDLQGTLENPLVIINGGEFQSLDARATLDLLELFGQNVFVAGNGGTLVYEDKDGYVSITNSNPVTAAKKVKDLNVNVYPNPTAGGNFTVEVPSGENVNVTVYNAVGQSVFSSNYSNQGSIVVNADLNKGLYVVQISSANSNSFATQKLIVQ